MGEDARRTAASLIALGKASIAESCDAQVSLRHTTEGLANRYGAIREQLAGPVRFVAASSSLRETLAEIDAIDDTTRELLELVAQLDQRVAQLEAMAAA